MSITSKMELIVTMFNGFKALFILTKFFILSTAGFLNPLLDFLKKIFSGCVNVIICTVLLQFPNTNFMLW